MRTFIRTVSICAFALAVLPFSVRAEHVRVTNPNAVSVEALGRGLLYSVDYDRVVSDDIVVGVGIGSTSMRTLGDVDAGISTALIPIYANLYLIRDGNSPFVTAGADIVTNSGQLAGLKSTFGGMEFNSNAVLPTFGVGFEARTDAGFMARLTAYGVIAKGFNPWGGLTLGYSF